MARIKCGLDTELRMGNLDAQRDWGYAADYVRAMWLMVQQDTPTDYVVASGETHSVRELCEIAFSVAGLNWEDHVVVDERLCGRPRSTCWSVTPKRVTEELGWKREVDFPSLVEMMVEADLAVVRSQLG